MGWLSLLLKVWPAIWKMMTYSTPPPAPPPSLPPDVAADRRSQPEGELTFLRPGAQLVVLTIAVLAAVVGARYWDLKQTRKAEQAKSNADWRGDIDQFVKETKPALAENTSAVRAVREDVVEMKEMVKEQGQQILFISRILIESANRGRGRARNAGLEAESAPTPGLPASTVEKASVEEQRLFWVPKE